MDDHPGAQVVLYCIWVTAWVMGMATAIKFYGFWISVLCIFVPPAAWVTLAYHFMWL